MKKAFTLFELLLVVIIIGVLAVLGFPNFFRTKESTLEKEAQANLRLMSAAEKIYHLEHDFYFPYSGSQSALDTINTNLKLSLPAQNWNYKTDGGRDVFTAKAQRATDPANVWCIDQAVDTPYSANCNW